MEREGKGGGREGGGTEGREGEGMKNGSAFRFATMQTIHYCGGQGMELRGGLGRYKICCVHRTQLLNTMCAQADSNVGQSANQLRTLYLHTADSRKLT